MKRLLLEVRCGGAVNRRACGRLLAKVWQDGGELRLEYSTVLPFKDGAVIGPLRQRVRTRRGEPEPVSPLAEKGDARVAPQVRESYDPVAPDSGWYINCARCGRVAVESDDLLGAVQQMRPLDGKRTITVAPTHRR